MKNISVLELHALSDSVEVIDVRMPTEYRQMHAECARNVPLEKLDVKKFLSSRNGHSGQPLYVICRGGNRSELACQKFMNEGFTDVVNVEGGTLAWEKAGLPLVRGRNALPLLRQVQITAGSMILIGMILAYLVSPSFLGLSAFVGAGLVFAGVTGFCPLSSLIAQMPWNQCDTGQCNS